MLKSWTDTHYKLDDADWLYIAASEEQGSVSLVCPGYARDGEGFSIHFQAAHIQMLEHLLGTLKAIKSKAQREINGEYHYPEPLTTKHLIS